MGGSRGVALGASATPLDKIILKKILVGGAISNII